MAGIQLSPNPASLGIPRAVAGTLIIGSIIVVYANSLRCPFLFDDQWAIVENESIRSLWPPWAALQPPNQTTVAGRPVVNLSLAVNYAISDLQVGGFHAFNVAVHVGCALLIWQIVRATFNTERLVGRFGKHAGALATATALIWAVHPLHTMCVTYVVQRAESLMALFCLLTIFCAARGATSGRPGPWYAAAVGACAVGMGCKESCVTAPLAVLLYDAVFLAGSIRNALRRRRALYISLAATWLVLALLVAKTPRSESAGFALREVNSLEYLRTQPEIILHYLRMIFWPHPLCLDYDWPLEHSWPWILLSGICVLGLLLLGFIAAVNRRAWGFVIVCFFLLLAPTSSFVPQIVLASEHRLYFPSALIIALVVAGIWTLLHNAPRRQSKVSPAAAAVLLTTCLLGGMTVIRNWDYRSAVTIWADTVDRRPKNPRARNNLGMALSHAGQTEAALSQLREAVRILPGYADAQYNLGTLLATNGRLQEATPYLEKAVKLNSSDATYRFNLAREYELLGRPNEAVDHYREAARLKPDYAKAHTGLGLALAARGEHRSAVTALRAAVRLDPQGPIPINALAWLLATSSDEQVRSGHEAVPLANKACDLTRHENAGCLDTLAAAHAESGDFAMAVSIANEAIKTATERRQDDMAAAIRNRIEYYQKGKPFRETSGAALQP